MGFISSATEMIMKGVRGAGVLRGSSAKRCSQSESQANFKRVNECAPLWPSASLRYASSASLILLALHL